MLKLLVIPLIIFLTANCGSMNTEKKNSRGKKNSTSENPPPYQQPPQYAPAPFPIQQNQSAQCYKGQQRICEIEYQITQITNEYRAEKGLNPVEHDSQLSFVSRDWSRKQAAEYGLGHKGFTRNWREDVFLNEFNVGPSFNLSAENVAYNYCGDGSPREVAQGFMDQWIGSWGHRRNIKGNHKRLGAGVHVSPSGKCYGTQIFGR